MKRLSKVLAFILVMLIILPGVVNAENVSNIIRLHGDNRVDTAIDVSKNAYSEQVDSLLLAGYNGDADALAATFMAGQIDAPLLIADKSKLSSNLLAEIKRLNPKEIILLGGNKVISLEIENQLKALNYNTSRMSGNSRIETAVNIVEDYYGDKELKEVFIVEYNSLVDALAIGPVAAKTGTPVLLMKKDYLSDEVKDFLKNKKIEKVTIIGGEGTVSPTGMKEIEKIVSDVKRVYGNDRIETSINIGKKYFENPKHAFVANGWKNADALIGGYFAAMKNAPILLAHEEDLKESGLDYLDNGLEGAYILGGKSVVDEYVFDLVKWSVDGRVEEKPDKEISRILHYSQVILPQFDMVKGFSEGLAAVRKDGKCGYINTSGETVIDFKYDTAYSFSEGKALVGNLVNPEELVDDELVDFGVYIKLGLIDKNNKYTPLTMDDNQEFENDYIFHIPEMRDDITLFNGFLNLPVDGPSDYMFDKNGKFYYDGDHNLWNRPTEGVWTTLYPTNFIDMKTGKLLFKNAEFSQVRPFNQGLAPVSFYDSKNDREYWTFIDKQGKRWKGKDFSNFKVMGLETVYTVFGDHSLASIQDFNGKWGAVNKAGKVIIPYKYEDLGTFNEGLAAFKLNNKYGYIDAKEKQVIKGQFDNVSMFSDGLASALQGDKTFLIDKKGKKIQGDSNIYSPHYFQENYYGEGYIVHSPSEYLVIEENSKFGFAKIIED